MKNNGKNDAVEKFHGAIGSQTTYAYAVAVSTAPEQSGYRDTLLAAAYIVFTLKWLAA